MSAVLQLFWATLERVFPRVGAALVMLFFARYTSPESVGIYSWVALAYTLYQAVAENALRTMAVLCLRNDGDIAYIRRRAFISAVCGSAALVAALVMLEIFYPHQRSIVTGLLPFVLVPWVTTAHILPAARLQYDQQWQALARFQLFAAAAGLLVSMTVVLVFHSSAAMALHALMSEGVFCWLVARAARAVHVPHDEPTRHPAREATGMVAVNALGWGQNQLERVVMGSLAGPTVLGLYATAAVMGRSPAEALAAATSNFVRSKVAQSAEKDQQARVVRGIGLISVIVAAGGTLLLIALVDLVLAPFLGPKYDATLLAVPLFATACIPVSVSLTLQVMAVANGRSRAAVVSSVAGLACALPIGWAATSSVALAALFVAVKELLVLWATYVTARQPGARLPVAVASLSTVVGLAALYQFGGAHL